jgi:hypothetical protein
MKSDTALCMVFSAVFNLALTGCVKSPSEPNRPNPIVGAWFVKDAGAPFPYHMYVFNADGTMQQANPDAGDPRTSDSDGKGIWVADGGIGTLTARSYDANETLVGGPTSPSQFEGKRVTLP